MPVCLSITDFLPATFVFSPTWNKNVTTHHRSVVFSFFCFFHFSVCVGFWVSDDVNTLSVSTLCPWLSVCLSLCLPLSVSILFCPWLSVSTRLFCHWLALLFCYWLSVSTLQSVTVSTLLWLTICLYSSVNECLYSSVTICLCSSVTVCLYSSLADCLSLLFCHCLSLLFCHWLSVSTLCPWLSLLFCHWLSLLSVPDCLYSSVTDCLYFSLTDCLSLLSVLDCLSLLVSIPDCPSVSLFVCVRARFCVKCWAHKLQPQLFCCWCFYVSSCLGGCKGFLSKGHYHAQFYCWAIKIVASPGSLSDSSNFENRIAHTN